MKIKSLVLALAATMALASCANVKNITYFQDAQESGTSKTAPAKQIKIRPQDAISVIVTTQDPRLASMFNLAYTQNMLGQNQTNYVTPHGVCGYVVDAEGNIDFPVLGKIQLEGLTRTEACELIKSKLVEKDLVKDPVVTIDFVNLKFSVIGEVSRPGRFAIDRDDVTILDAISQAGDLTIYGLRTNVTVARTEGEDVKYYKVDLTSTESLMNSPVYYLQQNDVVYVAPNDLRQRQSTLNGNTVLSSSFWMSMASLLLTIVLAIK